VATLHELETWYSIDDILDRNEALDFKYEAERRHNEQQAAKQKGYR